LINAFANALPATLFVLFVSHVIGAGERYGDLLLAYFLAGLAAIPLWIRLARLIGKHRAWLAAMTIACAAFAFVPFLGDGDLLGFLIICLVSGAGVGADLVLPASIQADVIDADTQISGEERAGLFFALWGIATKSAFALAALSMPILAFYDFSADALDLAERSLNSSEALSALVILYAVVPVAIKLIAIALMWRFPLNETRQHAIRASLDARG
jgi:Na+/melibiose symporter-like transporter